MKHKPDFASKIKASFTVHYKFCVNILRNKDKTAFHSFSLDSVCNQIFIFQKLFHIQKFTVFFLHTVNSGIMFILIWPQKFDHEINIWPWDIWPQIREQMLVPDILWYEKSILGWFGQSGRTCEKKFGANYEQLFKEFFYVFKGKKKLKIS